MNELIPIHDRLIGEEAVAAVDARELHAFLRIGKDFSNWIKARIGQYGFIENVDFVVFANSGENLSGGRPTKEYALTLDMAKELSMVERNDQGKRPPRSASPATPHIWLAPTSRSPAASTAIAAPGRRMIQ